MNDDRHAVTWFNSESVSARMRCVRWQPSALDGGRLGYLLFARRDDPCDMWPTLEMSRGLDRPVPLDFARSFAKGYGCTCSTDDPGEEPEPIPPGEDPDTYVTINLNEPQVRLLRGIVSSLVYFTPTDENLTRLAVQLRHHLRVVD